MHGIHFKSLREWGWRLDVLGERGQDHILKLDGVVGQRVDKVEVEVADELWIILQDDKYDIHCGCVEASHRCRGLHSWQHVVLDEGEAADKQVLDLVVLEDYIVHILLLLVFQEFLGLILSIL